VLYYLYAARISARLRAIFCARFCVYPRLSMKAPRARSDCPNEAALPEDTP
jgi:hypothetical protein